MLCAAALLPAQPLITNSAYGDTETSVGNIFQAGVWGGISTEPDPFDIVLNEFLPNPDSTANGLNFGDDNDSNPLGEWVELYNKGDVAQDLAGWYLEDASGGGGNTQAVISGSNTDTGGTIIAVHGWLVVFMNKTTLNNTGDEIHLFTPTDVEVDSVVYDDPSNACELPPTPGDENSTSTPTGTPDNSPNADCIANQVAPNKSYARIPDGTGAWIDPIPTPGAPNILDEESAEALGQSGGGAEAAAAEPELEVEVSNEPLEITEPASSTPSNEPEFEVEVSDEPLEVVEPTPEPAPTEDPAPEETVEEEPTPESEPDPEPEPEPEPEVEEAPAEVAPEPAPASEE